MEIKKFNISAFGIILGTGGVALASQAFLPYLTLLLTYLLSALFAIFTALFVAKIIKYPGTVKTELQHPVPGNFYGLQPISAVILSILYGKLFHFPMISLGLLVYGTVFIFALTVYLPYHFFSDMNVEFTHLHGGWFITPVANILVTNAILFYPVSATNLIISLLFLGIGTMLFLLILSVIFFRLLSHNLPPAELAPTNIIMLAPIGILIVDFFQISNAAGPFLGMNLAPIAILIGTFLWGFAIWIISVNLLLFRKYMQAGFPFHMGWWAYVFPTAAFTLGTMSLSGPLEPFRSVSLFVYVSLVVIWALISVGTLISWVKSIAAGSKIKIEQASSRSDTMV